MNLSISGDKNAMMYAKTAAAGKLARKTKSLKEYHLYLNRLKSEFKQKFRKKIENYSRITDFTLIRVLGMGAFGKVPSMKKKIFEEYRQYLNKLKSEFDEIYEKKIENFSKITDFTLISCLGVGSFGQVILVKNNLNSKHYAMKVMTKRKIVKERQLAHTLNEKNILEAIRFPFCLYMEFSFKDNSNIYFVLPYMAGGDMFTHLRRLKTFKEKDAKFYASQICLALEYLHHLNLVFRDLKPENICLDVTGYVRLADFGFCKQVKERTYTLCGTPEYIAPEIILSKGYGRAVDWWSFGVFIFEMIAGYTPFVAEEPMKIYERITSGKYRFTLDFSIESKDLLRNLLQVDLTRRYGNLRDGVVDIKTHAWFKIIDWQAIHNRKAVAPFMPKVKGATDTSNFDKFDGIPTIHVDEMVKYQEEFANF